MQRPCGEGGSREGEDGVTGTGGSGGPRGAAQIQHCIWVRTGGLSAELGSPSRRATLACQLHLLVFSGFHCGLCKRKPGIRKACQARIAPQPHHWKRGVSPLDHQGLPLKWSVLDYSSLFSFGM